MQWNPLKIELRAGHLVGHDPGWTSLKVAEEAAEMLRWFGHKHVISGKSWDITEQGPDLRKGADSYL